MLKRECKCIMKEKSIIYAIIFENNKVYIGQTSRGLHNVVREHDSMKRNCRDNKPVYNAMREFKHIYMVLECTTNLSERVIYWSDIFNSMAPNGYNLRINGNQIKISDELRNRKKGFKNYNARTVEYYSKNAIPDIDFKIACKIKGWQYENFDKIETNDKWCKEKRYYFILKETLKNK